MAVRKFLTVWAGYVIADGEKVTTALTPREFYIALELCDGHSYKDLAEKLDLSASRIAKQVQTIFSKLGINRKDQLAKFVW